jgi:hypothetical protein
MALIHWIWTVGVPAIGGIGTGWAGWARNPAEGIALGIAVFAILFVCCLLALGYRTEHGGIRGRKPTLEINFNNDGGRVQTTFGNGQATVFYRLTVTNHTGRTAHGCRGILVAIGRRDALGGIIPSGYAERLSLTWATHANPLPTSLDIRDGESAFLDVVCVLPGGVGMIATPGFVRPNSLSEDFFRNSTLSLLTVSISADEGQAQQRTLELFYKGSLHNSTARMVE